MEEWKFFLENKKDPLPKSPFQKKMFKNHPKKKKDLIGKGGNKYKSKPYTKKPSMKRSKSAPPLGEAKIKVILKEFISMFDYSSFNVRDSLNPAFWGERDVLKAEVANKLIQIGRDFFENNLKFPKNVELIDIKFTGSLANYNWTDNSDIDLHLVIDFKKTGADPKLIRDYVNSKKNLWNEQHDIMMKGHEVEIYVENLNEKHYSTGVYSLLNNEWIVKPSPAKPNIDDQQIMVKINGFQQKLDHLKDLFAKGQYKSSFIYAENLMDKLKNMRTAGLVKGGEFSVENLTYKALRKVGVIEEIFDLKHEAYDKMMSVGTSGNTPGEYPVDQGTLVYSNLQERLRLTMRQDIDRNFLHHADHLAYDTENGTLKFLKMEGDTAVFEIESNEKPGEFFKMAIQFEEYREIMSNPELPLLNKKLLRLSKDQRVHSKFIVLVRLSSIIINTWRQIKVMQYTLKRLRQIFETHLIEG